MDEFFGKQSFFGFEGLSFGLGSPMIYSIDTLWGFGMKRYFLGLALALMLIPGITRADIVGTLSNGAVTGDGTTNQTSKLKLTFGANLTNINVSSIALYAGSSTSGTVSFDFQAFDSAGTVQIGSTKTFSGQSLSLVGSTFNLNNFDASSSAFAANTEYQIWITASSNSAKVGLVTSPLLTTDNTSIYQNVYTGSAGQYTGGSDKYKIDLITTAVPEPATLVLTGSVFAVGFGASMLRRFRKKTVTQESAT